VIFNTSPTGSGKTFSWIKPVLDNDMAATVVYPTNALIEDQVEAANNFHENYFPEKDFRYEKLTRAAVSQEKKKLGTSSNGKAASQIVRRLNFLNNEPSILFTNPDTLILILKRMYGPEGQYLESLINGSGLLIIDEFHMAEVKQRNDLLYTASYLMRNDLSNIKTTVFLSATPDMKTTEPLREIFQEIDLINSDTKSEDFPSAKKIMPEVNLEVETAELFCTSEKILEDFQSKVIDICKSGRTVIMLDSLREVDELYSYANKKLTDLQIERIDGFHRENIEEKLDTFDVLVSNSAVEVGVDFEVKNLIFSAFDSSTFMQRIGRLRNVEEAGENIILCFTDEKLAKAELDQSLSREKLEEVVKEKLGTNNRPQSFTRTYSVKEWVYHTLKLREKLTDSEKKKYLELSFELIKNLFSTNEFKVTDNYLQKEIDFIENNYRLLETLQVLETYRGESFQALLFDSQEEQLKTYNLRHLLAWGKVDFINSAQLKDRIPEKQQNKFEGLEDYVEGYCIYHGRREQRRNVRLRPFNSGEFMGHLRKSEANPISKPERLDGIAFQTDPEIKTIGKLNEYIKERKMVVKSANGHPSKIQSLYGTSDYLMLYFTETPPGMPIMSTALGLNAFYLARRISDNKI